MAKACVVAFLVQTCKATSELSLQRKVNDRQVNVKTTRVASSFKKNQEMSHINHSGKKPESHSVRINLLSSFVNARVDKRVI